MSGRPGEVVVEGIGEEGDMRVSIGETYLLGDEDKLVLEKDKDWDEEGRDKVR